MADRDKREDIDPEMIENLQILIHMDILEHEKDWQDLEEMDEIGEALNDEESSDEA